VIAEELGFRRADRGRRCSRWWCSAFIIGRQAIKLGRYFAGLVAQGIGIWLGVQSFINMGVNMGLLPTKGLTLPLMSFGGSGIVANCLHPRQGQTLALRQSGHRLGRQPGASAHRRPARTGRPHGRTRGPSPPAGGGRQPGCPGPQ
jgi:hypothetical protein